MHHITGMDGVMVRIIVVSFLHFRKEFKDLLRVYGLGFVELAPNEEVIQQVAKLISLLEIEDRKNVECIASDVLEVLLQLE